MRLSGIIVGVLILTAGHMPTEPYSDRGVIAIAAAGVPSGGSQGVSGHPQRNSTIKGSPKPNATISGSQSRGKH